MIRSFFVLVALAGLFAFACTSTKSSSKGAVVPPIDNRSAAADSMPSLPSHLPPMPPPSLPGSVTTGPASVMPSGPEAYQVQIFASVSQEGAESQAQRARSRQSEAVDVRNIGGLWKVRLGSYPDRQTAEMARDRVRQLGWSDAWIVTPNSDMGAMPSYAPQGTESYSANEAGNFSVQVAASHYKEEAQQIMNNLASLGINKVYLSEDGGLCKVRVGTFPNRAEGEKMKEQLRNIGFADAFIVTEQK